MIATKQLTAPAEGRKSLADCQIIWFYPGATVEEESNWLTELKALSKHEIISIQITKDAINYIQNPGSFILISRGSKYAEIREAAENSSNVRMIIIYTQNIIKYLHYHEEHIKVWLITNDITEVEKSLTEGYQEYIKFHKFEEMFTERTFYTMKDYEFLMRNLSLMTSAHEGINIFYPFGYGAVFMERQSALRVELKMMLKNLVPILAITNKEESEDMEKLLVQLLGSALTPKDILGAYTDEGIYLTLNEYLRSGDSIKIKDIKEFAYHLRGSMYQLGDPIIRPNTTVYRGLYMPIHSANFWAENIGNLVLLPSYTSTSLELEQALKFTKGPTTGMRKVIMEITLIKDQEIFLEQMEKFTEEEEIYNGCYYPVEIKEYSKCPEEDEILFPHLYPLIIQEIKQSATKDKMLRIKCIAPVSLSFGQNRAWRAVRSGGQIEEREYKKYTLTKMISLLNQDILSTIDLCI